MTDGCNNCGLTQAKENSREDLHHAIRLESWTIMWMIAEAVVSTCAGVVEKSLLLVAFGADSIVRAD
jgi:hypothetical protein